MITVQCFDIGG